MSGRLASRHEDQDFEEVVAVPRHTEASPFTLLRRRLHESAAVTELRDPAGLEEIGPGTLVEMAGEVAGNPLQQLLLLMARIAPIVGIDVQKLVEAGGSKKRTHKTSQHQQGQAGLDPEAAEGMRLFIGLTGEILDTKVRDVVLLGDEGLKAVLTLASDSVDESAEEYLQESSVRVLAKVTRIVKAGEPPINLTRRTALGLMESRHTEGLISEARASFEEGLHADISDPLVSGPAAQPLPLAIFV